MKKGAKKGTNKLAEEITAEAMRQRNLGINSPANHSCDKHRGESFCCCA